MTAEQTPAALGYRWPAEWERHAATWVAWPHNRETWPGKFDLIPPQFARLVEVVARCEAVHVLAGGADVMAQAQFFLAGVPNVTLWDVETNDAWCRDHGPTFLVGAGEAAPAVVDWPYNAWGGKYPPFGKDNAVARRLADLRGLRCFAARVVLEGGAIEGNGRGTVLTTASCLLNSNRNPGWSRESIEWYLSEYLGAVKVLWLPRGELAGDDTDGHVDQLARFVNPTTVIAAVADDPADENHKPLRENYEQLCGLTDQDGNRLSIIRLPLPRPKFLEHQRLPASYCNFYIANGLVVVPEFDDPADEVAIQTLQQLFPERSVIGLPATDVISGLGAWHCLTQQEPALS